MAAAKLLGGATLAALAAGVAVWVEGVVPAGAGPTLACAVATSPEGAAALLADVIDAGTPTPKGFSGACVPWMAAGAATWAA